VEKVERRTQRLYRVLSSLERFVVSVHGRNGEKCVAGLVDDIYISAADTSRRISSA